MLVSHRPLHYDVSPASQKNSMPQLDDVRPTEDACIGAEARRFANRSFISLDPADRSWDKSLDFRKPFPLYYGNYMLGNISAMVFPHIQDGVLRGIIIDINASKSPLVTPSKVYARVCKVAPEAHKQGLRIAAAIGDQPFEEPLPGGLKHLRNIFEVSGIIAAPTLKIAVEALKTT